MRWSDTIMSGLSRRPINSVSSRETRRLEIEVSGSAARHSRVTSSTKFSTLKRRPHANWSCTKSSDQRAFALRFNQDRRSRADSPVRTALAHCQSFLPVEPTDAIDPGRLALVTQQDEQPPIAEAPGRSLVWSRILPRTDTPTISCQTFRASAPPA